MPGAIRRTFRAHPVISTAVLVALLTVGWYGATQTGDSAAERDWEDGVVTHVQRDLHLTSIVNEAPEDLTIRIVTPWDYREVEVPGRSEAGVVWFVRCEGGPFELQLSAWRAGGEELVRDERIESFSCPKGPQVVILRDEVSHYTLAVEPDPLMPS